MMSYSSSEMFGRDVLSLATWPDDAFIKTELSAAHGGDTGPDGLPAFFSWSEEPAGAEFADEIESVSRLYQHVEPAAYLSLSPLSSSSDDDNGDGEGVLMALNELVAGAQEDDAADDAAVVVSHRALACGETLPEFGEADDVASFELPVGGGSPDQCLMSPTDVLLASPEPALSPSLSPATQPLPLSPIALDANDALVKVTEVTLKGSAAVTECYEDHDVHKVPRIKTARSIPVIKHSPSPRVEFATGSPNIAKIAVFSSTAAAGECEQQMFHSEYPSNTNKTVQMKRKADDTLAVAMETILQDVASTDMAMLEEENEHMGMIDQALEDLKTLESMCGITSDDDDSALGKVLSSQVTTVGSSVRSISRASTPSATPYSPVPSLSSASMKASSSPCISSCSSVAAHARTLSTSRCSSVKSNQTTAINSEVLVHEPMDEDDIQIIEEVEKAPSRFATSCLVRRRRVPRAAVTPPRPTAATTATNRVMDGPDVVTVALRPAAPTQIVIVLTEKQMASIQKSGRIVLNDAALETAATVGEDQHVNKSIKKAVSPAAADVSPIKVKKKSSTVSTKTLRRRRMVAAAAGAGAAGDAKKKTKTVRKRFQKAGVKGPLSGWPQPKTPLSVGIDWRVTVAPPPSGDQHLTTTTEADTAAIPDDLQDLFFDSSCSVPSLPDDNANSILEDLISGSVHENDSLFGDVSPASDMSDCGGSLLTSGESLGLQQTELAAAASAPVQRQQQQHHSPGYSSDFSGASPLQMSVLESVPQLLSPDVVGGLVGGQEGWPPRRRRRGPRSRPYDRPTGEAAAGAARKQQMSEEERRQRKKEQNKNAATRYRQKKKEQQETVSCDQEFLQSRNKQLRARVGGLTKELVYLRQLMREVLQRRRNDA